MGWITLHIPLHSLTILVSRPMAPLLLRGRGGGQQSITPSWEHSIDLPGTHFIITIVIPFTEVPFAGHSPLSCQVLGSTPGEQSPYSPKVHLTVPLREL